MTVVKLNITSEGYIGLQVIKNAQIENIQGKCLQ